MTPEDVWRSKTDDEVLAAISRLNEYTDLGQRLILSEFDRRHLVRPDLSVAVTESGVVASDAGLFAVTVAEPLPPSSNNPLIRLWRGEFSLPATYWLWGLFGNLVFWVAFELSKGATSNVAVLLLLILLGLAYYVICIVGIWRSSGRYTGNKIWRDLARSMIVIGILRLLATL